MARRIYPRNGQPLTFSAVRGAWQPTRTVGGETMFGIMWSTASGTPCVAALHDFDDEAQRTLIAQCRAVDQAAIWRERMEHS